jgi:hypothetical protein
LCQLCGEPSDQRPRGRSGQRPARGTRRDRA